MKKYFAFSILCLFCSCEYSYDYVYVVDNNCDTSAVVEFKAHDIDTVYIIPANTSKVLFETTHGIESRGGPFAGGAEGIMRMAVSLRGNYGKRNYSDDKSWIFSKDDNKGINTTVLTNDNY